MMFQAHKNRWRGRIDAVIGGRCPVERSMNQKVVMLDRKNTEIALKSMCATQQCGEFNRNALLKCDPKHKIPFVIVFVFFYTKKRFCIIFSQDFLETFSSKGFLWTMAAFSML